MEPTQSWCSLLSEGSPDAASFWGPTFPMLSACTSIPSVIAHHQFDTNCCYICRSVIWSRVKQNTHKIGIFFLIRVAKYLRRLDCPTRSQAMTEHLIIILQYRPPCHRHMRARRRHPSAEANAGRHFSTAEITAAARRSLHRIFISFRPLRWQRQQYVVESDQSHGAAE